MSILGVSYAVIGAAVGYNAYREMQHGAIAVSMLTTNAEEGNPLSTEGLQDCAKAALLGIVVFSAVAWPVVVLYNEVEKAVK